MPNSHRIEPDSRLAHVSVWGPPNAASAVRAIQELAGDPAFEPHFHVLVDARKLDDGDAPLDQIEEVANSLRGLRNRFQGKVAILARIGPHYDLLKLMCAFASTYGLHVRVFAESARAQVWLAQD